MNAALVGMSAGETKDITLTYAEDHPSAALAGKTYSYTVTLKALKEKVVPAADDEFAKDLGDFESLAELRESVRKRLLAADERKVDREVEGRSRGGPRRPRPASRCPRRSWSAT